MRRIVISGLVAVAAVLAGGVAVPATAMAQPSGVATARPTAITSRAPLAARAADEDEESNAGDPLISCVLTTDCLGVEGGSSLTIGADVPVTAARWNGTSWKGVHVALPKGATSADVNGVSCKGAKSCLVVGDYYKSTSANGSDNTLALALVYNGTSLKPAPALPLPKGATDAALISVSCTQATHCIALGDADANVPVVGAYSPLTLIEIWNGKKWTLRTVAASTRTTSTEVSGFSCATSAFCVLTGETSPFAGTASKLYVASWNGKKLTTMKTAAGSSSEPAPVDISCATTRNCALTGYYLSGGGDFSPPTVVPFSEIWNGATWRLAKVKWPAGLAEAAVLGVSCYGAHSCEGVGLEEASLFAPAKAVALSFTGTASTMQAVPAPSANTTDVFTGVSCLPGGSCVAVGEIEKLTAETPSTMTGVWNGKTWKLHPGF